MSKHIVYAHVFFFLSWPFGVMAIGFAANGITTNRSYRITGWIAGAILMGALVGFADRFLTKS